MMLSIPISVFAQQADTEKQPEEMTMIVFTDANERMYKKETDFLYSYYLDIPDDKKPERTEQESKNFDLKTRTFANDPRTQNTFNVIRQNALRAFGKKTLKAFYDETAGKCMFTISLYIDESGEISNVLFSVSPKSDVLPLETIYKLMQNVKRRCKFKHYASLKKVYPYRGGNTQVATAVSMRDIAAYINQ